MVPQIRHKPRLATELRLERQQPRLPNNQVKELKMLTNFLCVVRPTLVGSAIDRGFTQRRSTTYKDNCRWIFLNASMTLQRLIL